MGSKFSKQPFFIDEEDISSRWRVKQQVERRAKLRQLKIEETQNAEEEDEPLLGPHFMWSVKLKKSRRQPRSGRR